MRTFHPCGDCAATDAASANVAANSRKRRTIRDTSYMPEAYCSQITPCLCPRGRGGGLRGRERSFEDAADDLVQAGRFDRLRQIVVHSGGEAPVAIFFESMGGEGDDRCPPAGAFLEGR